MIGGRIGCPRGATALFRLIGAGLIAYEAPLYQVLALDAPSPTAPPAKAYPRGAGELRSLHEILRQSSVAHR